MKHRSFRRWSAQSRASANKLLTSLWSNLKDQHQRAMTWWQARALVLHLDLFTFKYADDWLKDEDNAGNVSYTVHLVNEDEVVYRSVILNKMTTMCLWVTTNMKWSLNLQTKELNFCILFKVNWWALMLLKNIVDSFCTMSSRKVPDYVNMIGLRQNLIEH